MNATDPAPANTWHAGTLVLTVWPDSPLGEHQRYAYRIQDTATGQSIAGRDLFTGAGAPVAPARAVRDLAGFLSAAGEAHQYKIDHPDSSPEHEGLFPAWVADAARRNADELALLTAHEQADQPVGSRGWFSVVFLQGDEATRALDIIDRDGTDAAIEHLAGYDYGADTQRAAEANGHVYDLPGNTADRLATRDVYALTYNHRLGYVELRRELDSLPDPVLLGIDDPPTREQARPRRSQPGASPGAEPSWFDRPAGGSARDGRGLSL